MYNYLTKYIEMLEMLDNYTSGVQLVDKVYNGVCSGSVRVTHRVVAPKIVGSKPTRHPKIEVSSNGRTLGFDPEK